jgi:ERCC4-type nuclease
MIFVDPREGSKTLAEPLRKRGLEVVDDEQFDADIQFTGRGEGGRPVSIGVEYKKLSELLTSLRTERLQGYQLPTMRCLRDDGKPKYDFAYLLIEGEFVYDSKGLLMRRSGRSSFKPMGGRMLLGELFKRIHVLHLLGGLNPMFTRSQRDSVRWLEALYHTWTDTDLDKHKSHLAIYSPPPLVPMSPFVTHLVGGKYPGVGAAVARAAEKHFNKSLKRAINAPASEWAAIETVDANGKSKKFGLSHATKLVKEFN